MSFSQLPAVKKKTIFGAARKIFGPSYFVMVLTNFSFLCIRTNRIVRAADFNYQGKYVNFYFWIQSSSFDAPSVIDGWVDFNPGAVRKSQSCRECFQANFDVAHLSKVSIAYSRIFRIFTKYKKILCKSSQIYPFYTWHVVNN